MIQHFEWDAQKAKSNLKKHGVSFEEAELIFDDSFAISRQDRVEGGEERWQTIGMSGGCLLLMAAHTLRDEDGEITVVRIISARRADRTERRLYERGQA